VQKQIKNKTYSRSSGNLELNYSKQSTSKKSYPNYKRKNFNNSYSNSTYKNSTNPISHSKYIKKASSNETVSVFDAQIKFKDLKINSKLQESIYKNGFYKLTKIQALIIPHILENKDALAISETGSGKTGAFLIPMLNKIIMQEQQKCLIITPTREIALQIQQELYRFTVNLNVKSTVITGGASMSNQIYSIKRNPHFVIATPGRLKDLFQRKQVKLEIFNNVILDEVDRMLDMGFIRDIEFFISKLPKSKQSLFFSATLNKKAESIAEKFLNNPIKINITSKKTDNIEQSIVKVNTHQQKIQVLKDLLNDKDFNKVLVFSRTKRGTDKIYLDLKKNGFKVGSIHGDKSQNNRNITIKDFKNDVIKILIATSVAIRILIS